jgi:hypothetical protein
MKIISLLIVSLALHTTAIAQQSMSNRSALIIGVSEYAPQSGAPSLVGVPYDMKSAARIANAMGIGNENIRYIQNSAATKENILKPAEKAIIN